jgi:hypothetical protein
MNHVKSLVSLFPCARALVSKKLLVSNPHKLRQLRKLMGVFAIPAMSPSQDEVEDALRWLGVGGGSGD